MKTQENTRYITVNKQQISVTEEVWKAWNRVKDQTFHEAHKAGTCGNSNFATCCGDCALCKWNKEGIVISLDDETNHFHCCDHGPKRDYSPVKKVADPADILSDDDQFERVLSFAKKLCADGDIIFRLHYEQYSTYAISEETGIPQKTVYRRIQKITAELQKNWSRFR